jgi:hypothetical protein
MSTATQRRPADVSIASRNGPIRRCRSRGGR